MGTLACWMTYQRTDGVGMRAVAGPAIERRDTARSGCGLAPSPRSRARGSSHLRCRTLPEGDERPEPAAGQDARTPQRTFLSLSVSSSEL